MGPWRWCVLLLATAGCRQIFGLNDLPPGDGSGSDDAPGCVAVCADPQTLRQCNANGTTSDVACTWGCIPSGTEAQCGVFAPSGGGVTPADLAPASGLVPTTLVGATIDGDAGSIRQGGVGITGFQYVLENGIAVFRFQQLTIGSTLRLVGAHPIALVSLTDLDVDSTAQVDVQGECASNQAGPGGSAGGAPGMAGDGAGGGNAGAGPANHASGGGGGGHGTPGGRGGKGNANVLVLGGGVVGDAAIWSLAGGAGGGGGGGGHAGVGGGGGGALQLVANGTITIGGAINAGGCGGGHGGIDSSGAGGGAGGAILIEGRVVVLAPTAMIAVNGGGGGGGGGSDVGQDGESAAFQPARGGQGVNGSGGNGGDGGGTPLVTPTDGADDLVGGGGGGAPGRIRINTLDGAAMIDPSAAVMPGLGDAGTTSTQGEITIR